MLAGSSRQYSTLTANPGVNNDQMDGAFGEIVVTGADGNSCSQDIMGRDGVADINDTNRNVVLENGPF